MLFYQFNQKESIQKQQRKQIRMWETMKCSKKRSECAARFFQFKSNAFYGFTASFFLQELEEYIE